MAVTTIKALKDISPQKMLDIVPFKSTLYGPFMVLLGYKFVEALLLAQFLNGDYDAPRAIPVHELCFKICLQHSSVACVIKALQRLVDKKYVIVAKDPSSKNTRGSTKSYTVQRTNIDHDLKALGYQNGLAEVIGG